MVHIVVNVPVLLIQEQQLAIVALSNPSGCLIWQAFADAVIEELGLLVHGGSQTAERPLTRRAANGPQHLLPVAGECRGLDDISFLVQSTNVSRSASQLWSMRILDFDVQDLQCGNLT